MSFLERALGSSFIVPHITSNVSIAIYAVIYQIAFAIVATGAVQAMETGEFQAVRAIGRVFERIIPVLVVGVFFNAPGVITIAFGALLEPLSLSEIVVGGAMYATYFTAFLILMLWGCAACSAAVFERKGPFASMIRSARLTSGRRWTLAWATILTAFAFLAGTALMEAVIYVNLDRAAPAYQIGTTLVPALFMGIWPIFSGVCYHYLRLEKDVDRDSEFVRIFA